MIGHGEIDSQYRRPPWVTDGTRRKMPRSVYREHLAGEQPQEVYHARISKDAYNQNHKTIDDVKNTFEFCAKIRHRRMRKN